MRDDDTYVDIGLIVSVQMKKMCGAELLTDDPRN